MPFNPSEMFQVHCTRKGCSKRFEGSSVHEAMQKVLAHEVDPRHDEKVLEEKARLKVRSGK